MFYDVPTISSKIGVTPKGARLSDRMQLTAVTNLTYVIMGK